MNERTYHTIIVGSGAGGSAAAYNLVQADQQVLLLEKGGVLPRDGSTLDVKTVFKEGRYKNKDTWVDKKNNIFVPSEFYNVGGKTKWIAGSMIKPCRCSRWMPRPGWIPPAVPCLIRPSGPLPP